MFLSSLRNTSKILALRRWRPSASMCGYRTFFSGKSGCSLYIFELCKYAFYSSLFDFELLKLSQKRKCLVLYSSSLLVWLSKEISFPAWLFSQIVYKPLNLSSPHDMSVGYNQKYSLSDTPWTPTCCKIMLFYSPTWNWLRNDCAPPWELSFVLITVFLIWGLVYYERFWSGFCEKCYVFSLPIILSNPIWWESRSHS